MRKQQIHFWPTFINRDCKSFSPLAKGSWTPLSGMSLGVNFHAFDWSVDLNTVISLVAFFHLAHLCQKTHIVHCKNYILRIQ